MKKSKIEAKQSAMQANEAELQSIGFKDSDDLLKMSSDMTALEDEACDMDPDEKAKKLAKIEKHEKMK